MKPLVRENIHVFTDRLITLLDQRLEEPWGDLSYAGGVAGQLLGLINISSNHACFKLTTSRIEDYLMRLLSALPTQAIGLFSGAEGILFSALEIDDFYGLGLVEDVAQEYDQYLFDCICNDTSLPEHFDLISGHSGVVVYASYRAHTTKEKRLLHACVDKLQSMATEGGHGTYWFTKSEWVRGSGLSEAYPKGCIDLGMAHGQVGVLAALAYAITHGNDQRTSTKELLQRGLHYLKSVEDTRLGSHFSGVVGRQSSPRCAWCYGDLGSVATLRIVAEALGDPSVDEWSDQILQTISQNLIENFKLHDASLCHGSVGAAWLLRQVGPQYVELISQFEEQHLHAETGGLLDIAVSDRDVNLSLLEGWTGNALALVESIGVLGPCNWSLPLLVVGRRSGIRKMA